MRFEMIRNKRYSTLALISALLVFVTPISASAQQRLMELRGEITSPAFEGWWENDDGTFKLFYGYMNSNWEETFNVPIGSDNYFTVVEKVGTLNDLTVDGYDFAQADQGQPTHFYPRRNPFLFTIDVPADFGTREMVWTLKTQGQTLRAYGTLKADYSIDPQVISTEVGGNFGSLSDALRDNISPELRIEGESRRTVKVGQPLSLAVRASDPDNYPPPRPAPSKNDNLDTLYSPPSSIVAVSGPGLRFSWSVYRGPAKNVQFDPPQMKTYTDTRMYGNSPWSPPFTIPEPPADGRWVAEVTFDEPGEYVLRGVASDGSMFTYENLIVTVMR